MKQNLRFHKNLLVFSAWLYLVNTGPFVYFHFSLVCLPFKKKNSVVVLEIDRKAHSSTYYMKKSQIVCILAPFKNGPGMVAYFLTPERLHFCNTFSYIQTKPFFRDANKKRLQIQFRYFMRVKEYNLFD